MDTVTFDWRRAVVKADRTLRVPMTTPGWVWRTRFEEIARHAAGPSEAWGKIRIEMPGHILEVQDVEPGAEDALLRAVAEIAAEATRAAAVLEAADDDAAARVEANYNDAVKVAQRMQGRFRDRGDKTAATS